MDKKKDLKIIKSIPKIRNELKRLREKNRIIGFVPTMGALHNGHISLIKRARKENDVVVVSIYINPIQFSPGEDFNTYPRMLNEDVKICKMEGVDFIFNPKTLYLDDHLTYVNVDRIDNILCGKSRKNHFRGVATIVCKLFNIIIPDNAYFGQKDYQQFIIIDKMVNDLNIPVNLKMAPIIREKNGLAMSSRNKYLTEKQFSGASNLYKALKLGRDSIIKGEISSSKIKRKIRTFLLKNINIKENNIDYISIISAKNFNEIKKCDENILIALAVRIGKARLIDNILVNIKKRG